MLEAIPQNMVGEREVLTWETCLKKWLNEAILGAKLYYIGKNHKTSKATTGDFKG